jgi:hypothetical protein
MTDVAPEPGLPSDADTAVPHSARIWNYWPFVVSYGRLDPGQPGSRDVPSVGGVGRKA